MFLKRSFQSLLFVWWWSGICLCIFTPVLEISQGKLRGLRSISGVNRYYGIPYANCDRFQPPKEPNKWDGIFDAVDFFGNCAQAISFIQTYKEDCLQLDIYTPEHAKRGDKLPVLVFMHGGAYYYGRKGHYDPEFLVTKNVTAVIINYRLGVLGFLCIRGVANLGLKDQVAALKWIKKNIAEFGGDPDNVTLSGQSAGASSAAMHMLSEQSKGLFHKTILMSGTSLTPWAFNVEPVRPAIQDARKIAEVQNIEDVYNIFAKSSLRDVLSSTVGTSDNTRYFKYSPCVDSNFTDPFFHGLPYNVIKSGNFNKVPMLIGVAELEGVLFYGLNDEKTFRDWEKNFIERLPSVFSWCSEEDKRLITKKIRSYYFGKRKVEKSAVNSIVNFYSDWIAHATIDAFSHMMTEYSDQKVYNYVFSYKGRRNFARTLLGHGVELKGSTHSDDIFYVFKPAGLSLLLSNYDKLFIDRFTTMLTNFMKYGNPTPRRTKLLPVTWPSSTVNMSYIMHLDSTLSVTSEPQPKPRGFFLNLLCTYGLNGYVPCESKEQCNLDEEEKKNMNKASSFR
ncbi:carboxyl/cholinesterase 3 [Aphomia sociella]